MSNAVFYRLYGSASRDAPSFPGSHGNFLEASFPSFVFLFSSTFIAFASFFLRSFGASFLRHLLRRRQFGSVLTLQFVWGFYSLLNGSVSVREIAQSPNSFSAAPISRAERSRKIGRFGGIFFFSSFTCHQSRNQTRCKFSDDYLALPIYRGHYRGELKFRHCVLIWRWSFKYGVSKRTQGFRRKLIFVSMTGWGMKVPVSSDDIDFVFIPRS